MRLIDADALIAEMRREPKFEKTDFDKRMIYIEKSVIDKQPTIEAVPVKHGRWIDDLGFYVCSVCDKSGAWNSWEVPWKSDYCPNCGAKMDLEEE